ncbi:MAG: sugar phosphate nucleotidyltransferase [Patescibacteria group bacterium]|nr:sugar phosphate nucleotidyltransferase [Patescibacteria group bacterium]
MAGSSKDHLYVLILCGGGGTRLWPRSRQKTPKQFLTNFFGEGTIFSQTVKRARLLTSNEKIFVVTTKDYVDEVLEQGQTIPPRNIIAEPIGRNTALAMGMGVAYIKRIDPEAIIVNLPSDQVVGNEDIFVEQMLWAVEAASQKKCLVAVGIKPTFPHTGYGYLKTSNKIADCREELYQVESFKEKPDYETAKIFFESGEYFWNANLYVWNVQTIWAAYARYLPEVFKKLEAVFTSIGKEDEEKIFNEVYEAAENISIDNGISEKADNLFLVPATFFWNDIGDWKVTYDLKEKDKEGNVFQVFGNGGEHLGVETSNCLIEAEKRLVATVGVSNLVIIETEDAILVCAKEKAQDVKKIVNLLKEKGEKERL